MWKTELKATNQCDTPTCISLCLWNNVDLRYNEVRESCGMKLAKKSFYNNNNKFLKKSDLWRRVDRISVLLHHTLLLLKDFLQA